ncbi:MAG: GAF domain-containing protein [Planctomycetota bacterium]
MSESDLLERVREFAANDDVGAILEATLAYFEGAVGTVHRVDEDPKFLRLVDQRGLPEALLPTVERIPIGKGMAGLAAARREPVQVCNLQTDASGVAKPGAKMTQMEGSISLPILVDDELHGTFGVGKPVAHEYGSEEVVLLESIAARLASVIR